MGTDIVPIPIRKSIERWRGRAPAARAGLDRAAHSSLTETSDAELTDREILAQSRHTTVKVLPKYVKRTTKQIATGTKKRRAARTKAGHLSERAPVCLSE
jgi:hypothetical protein